MSLRVSSTWASLFQRQLDEVTQISTAKTEGRSLEELKTSTDVLKGTESLRLRKFCTTERMEPKRDLAVYPFGLHLMLGNLEAVKADYAQRVSAYKDDIPNALSSKSPSLSAEERVRDDYYRMRWGPTEVTLYNLLALLACIAPVNYKSYMDMARFFIHKAKVPVDAQELSGTRALSHALSTKPIFNLELAQMLYDAGGDVNARNRYGGTVSHEFMLVNPFEGRQVFEQAHKALVWFLTHGGNVDIADGDGMTTREMCASLGQLNPVGMRPLLQALKNEDERRRRLGAKGCKCCGRTKEYGRLARCGGCKKVVYCDERSCQALDWPRHKTECRVSVQ